MTDLRIPTSAACSLVNMKGHGRTRAETLGGCFLKCLLCLYVLPFIPEAEDSIVDDRRLAYILQTICRTVDEQT